MGRSTNGATEQGPATTPQTSKPPSSKLASALSGSLSGAIVSACVQPLDVLRTRMQAEAQRGVMLSTVEASKLLWRENKIVAFWRGTQPTIIRITFGAGLNFLFLESLKPIFETKNKDGTVHMTSFGAAMTGGLSRAMAAMASCPITVIKTRMEYGGVGAAQYTSTVNALMTITKTEGVRALYSGLGPTVLSHAPFSAMYYAIYIKVKAKLQQEGRLPMAVNFASGTIAAGVATLATQPFDVLRTRMQLNLKTAGSAVVTGAAGSSLQIAQQIAYAQGTRGFMAGVAPRMLKRTLQAALVWTLYEEFLPRMTRAKEWAAQKMIPSGKIE